MVEQTNEDNYSLPGVGVKRRGFTAMYWKKRACELSHKFQL